MKKMIVASLLLTASLAGCAELQQMAVLEQQNLLAVEQSQAMTDCDTAGYTLATGRHEECVNNTIVQRRQQAAQARQQHSQEALAAGVQLWAASRTGAAMGAQQSTYGHGEASLSSQQWINYHNQCDYLTPSGMVSVVVSGSCPATYRY